MLCYVLYSIGVPIQGDCINSYEDPAVVEPITSQVSDPSECSGSVAGGWLLFRADLDTYTGDSQDLKRRKKIKNFIIYWFSQNFPHFFIVFLPFRS